MNGHLLTKTWFLDTSTYHTGRLISSRVRDDGWQGRKHELARQQDSVIVPGRRSSSGGWLCSSLRRIGGRPGGGHAPPAPTSVVVPQVVQLTILWLVKSSSWRTNSSQCNDAISLAGPVHADTVALMSTLSGLAAAPPAPPPPPPPPPAHPRGAWPCACTCIAPIGTTSW